LRGEARGRDEKMRFLREERENSMAPMLNGNVAESDKLTGRQNKRMDELTSCVAWSNAGTWRAAISGGVAAERHEATGVIVPDRLLKSNP
jgi:hypothetical protein